jgi:hypothetical protein
MHATGASSGGASATFDNFQFTPFNETLTLARKALAAKLDDYSGRYAPPSAAALAAATEATFALHALMEVPAQYREIQARKLLRPGTIAAARLRAVPTLDVPPGAAATAAAVTHSYPPSAAASGRLPPAAPQSQSPGAVSGGGGFVARGPAADAQARTRRASAEAARLRAELSALSDERICPVCLERRKDTVFSSCGHQACTECSSRLTTCPICRVPITGPRIRLF